MAKEALIVSWDDLALAAGERVRATSTVLLGLNGLIREVDVSAENHDRLVAFLKPYLDAGRKAERPAASTAGTGSSHRGYTYPPGAKQRKQALRDWADAQAAANPALAERYRYLSESGQFYYRKSLKQDYKAATGIDVDAPAGT